jgi:hypothetical protein
VGAETALAWRQSIERDEGADTEVWAIGGRSAVAASVVLGGRAVRIDDVLAPEANRLELTVATRTSQRRVELELPAAQLSARILRDPFGAAVAAITRPTSAITPTSSLVVVPGGVKVIARADGGVVSFPIPNSPRDKVGHPKAFGAQGLVCAVGRQSGKLALLIADRSDRSLTLQVGGHRRIHVGHFTTETRVHAPWQPEPHDPLARLMPLARDRFLYVDGRGWLFDLAEGTRLLARQVAAACATPDGVAFLARELVARPSEGDMWVHGFVDQAGEMHVTSLDGGPIVSARIVANPDRGIARRSVLALQRTSTTWQLRAGGSTLSLEVPSDAEVIGVLPSPTHTLGPVLLEADRRTVAHVTRGERTVLFTAATAIRHIAIDDSAVSLAALTAAGELILYSLRANAVVGRVDVRGAP